LGYEILSANVIIPKLRRSNPDVRIAVRRGAIELAIGHGAEEFVDIDELYGFRVRLRNRGNTVLENQPVAFRFDERARVILAELESGPEYHGRTTEVRVADSKTEATVTLPYLNPGQSAVMSIQTVLNPDLSCKVVAAAPGLSVFDMGRLRRALIAVVTGGLAALTMATVGTTLALAEWADFSETTSNVLRDVARWSFLAALISTAAAGPAVAEWAYSRSTKRGTPE
jgi:hypothetical protein